MPKTFVSLNPLAIKLDKGDRCIFLLLALHKLLEHIKTVTLESVREAVKGLHERIAAEVAAESAI